MTILQERAFAKINLTLDVFSKRSDGYHDLQSVMQTVSFFDDVCIAIDTGKPWSVSCDRQDVPVNPSNLSWRAAEVFFAATGIVCNGITVDIVKRIPSQAGLGGGSADAAAVLRALNRHYQSPFTAEELAQLGAQVGSDVPFCTLQGTAMAEGRGERLRRLPSMPDCFVVICKPDFSSSTPVLFQKLDSVDIAVRPDNRAMEQALLSGDLSEVCRHVYNVFDPVVSSEHPEIGQIKRHLRENGALAQQMTGSGSAVFGIFDDYAAALQAQKCLLDCGLPAVVAEPV